MSRKRSAGQLRKTEMVIDRQLGFTLDRRLNRGADGKGI